MAIDRTCRLVLTLVLLASVPRLAAGARIGPAPALDQFDAGFGFVAADVIDATPASSRNDYVDAYEVTFRVGRILAQPTVGGTISAVAGDVIHVRLTTGYAAMVEDHPETALASGNHFILTLKPAGGGRYRHADGASAVESERGLGDEYGKRYAALRPSR